MSSKHTSPGGSKIDLFICGAQKAGTTSLKHYLGEHPEVITHLQKEFAFFYDDCEYEQGEVKAFRKYFDACPPNKKIVAKNAGLYMKADAVQRLVKHNKDCNLVIVLRNPAERAYSAYQMEKNYGNFQGSFDEIRQLLKPGMESDWRYDFFIRMGMYSRQIQNILKHFPKEKLRVYRFEDLCSRPADVCTELFEVLKVNPAFRPDTSIKYNVTYNTRSSGYARFVKRLLQNNNPIKKIARTILPSQQDYKIGELMRNLNKSSSVPGKMSDAMREELTRYYAPYNAELTELTGIDFSSWNKLREGQLH